MSYIFDLASVTYFAFSVGAVYVVSNHAGPSYCWMEGNPVNHGGTIDSGSAMCGILTE